MAEETDEEQLQRGAELQKAGRFDAAVEVYLALAAKVLTVKLAINLGVCLGELGRRDQAEHYLGLAARHRPDEPVVRRLLGAAYGESGKIALAEAEYRAALALAPDDGYAQMALGGLYLSVGRYREGWPLLAPRVALHPHLVTSLALPYPEWRGEPLEGKSILVWLEQGFGDQIQFARFVNSLKAQGAAQVTLGCRPILADLFASLAGADTLIPVAAKTSVQVLPHDYWSHLFSLPEHLGVTLETLPAQPYLRAPADRLARWGDYPKAEGRKGRIGLAWKASPTGFNARGKGLPPEQAQRLLDRGAISLDPADTGVRDFADTAAIIESLDLVISIDTSVAHLAGALGKPCWTLLPFVHSDWRWLRDRSDTPWYPTMTLYRHGDREDWPEMIDRVLAALDAEDLAAGALRPA